MGNAQAAAEPAAPAAAAPVSAAPAFAAAMAAPAAAPAPTRLSAPVLPAPVAPAASSASTSSSSSQQSEIILSDGSRYRGELSGAGKPHGRGRLQFAWGGGYDGLFKDGRFDGIGVYLWPDGGRHEGEFVEGECSGLGARWDKHGKLLKRGRLTHDEFTEPCAVPLRCIPDGKYLSAAATQAKCDHPNNSALMQAGSHYIGELNGEGQPHGQGAIFHPDGSACFSLLADPADASNSGRWIEGKLQGRAVWIRSTGERYEGMFKEGRPHGQGASFHPGGSPAVSLLIDELDVSKSGRWVDGTVQGRATWINAVGDRYDGAFKDSRFDGLGVYLWSDGRRYEGEFVAGKFSGLGAEWNENGKLINCGLSREHEQIKSCAVPLRLLPEGKYLSAAAQQAKREHPNDSALLPDSAMCPDGAHYIGELNKQGQPHGQGACFHPDGSPFVTLLIDADASKSGRFVDGKVQGRAKQLFSDGDHYEGLFKHDLFGGLGVLSWSDGARYEGEWAAHQRSGLGAKWDKQGKLIECGQWAYDRLAKSCAIPLRLIPDGKFLGIAALQAKRDHPNNSALMPDGTHYTGDGANWIAAQRAWCESRADSDGSKSGCRVQ